jgi:molybdate transport system ATP-binding protein
LPGTVASVSSEHGPVADVLIDCGGQMIAARITGRSRLDLGIEQGRTVYAVIKSVSMDQAFAGPAVAGESS